MAASVELQAISHIVRFGDLKEALEWGITEEDFSVIEAKAYFNHLVAIYTDSETSGSVLGPNAAAHQFPNFELCDDESMTLEHHLKEVRRNRLILTKNKIAAALIEDKSADPMDAITAAREACHEAILVGASHNHDLDFATDGIYRVCDKYERKASGESTAKVHWPWRPLQDVTGGIQGGEDDEVDYIVIYGRPKNFKSWVMCYLMAACYIQPVRVLAYTKEMTATNISARMAACAARIPYQGLRAGNLGESDKEALFYLREMRAQEKGLPPGISQKFTVLSDRDAPKGGATMPWIRAKIEKYKPDVVFIDGLYLLAAAGKNLKDHERVMQISRSASELRLETKIPLIVTMQANRAAAKHNNAELDEIAYSDAIAQDATLAFRVIKEKTMPYVNLIVAGAREFEFTGLKINAIPAQNFTYHSTLDEKAVEVAKAEDTDDAEVATKAAKPYVRAKARTEEKVVDRTNGLSPDGVSPRGAPR